MADALDVPLGTQTGSPAWTAALDQAKARAFEQILVWCPCKLAPP